MNRDLSKLGLAPELNVQLFYGAISTFIELGVFKVCLTEFRTPDELADALGIVERAVFKKLLTTLASVGVFEQNGDGFRVAPGLDRKLGDEKKATLAMFDRLMSVWFDHLGAFLTTGVPLDIHGAGTMSPRQWKIYQSAMSVRSSGHRLATMTSFDAKPGRILDWAGGIGAVSKPLLDKFPSAESLIIELPNVVKMHDGVVNVGPYKDRLRFQIGDVTTYEPERASFDVVIMSAILHHLEPPDVQGLLMRSEAALKTGGTIAIEHGFPEEGTGDDPLMPLSDILFHVTSGEEDMTFKAFQGMVTEAGLRVVAREGALMLLKHL